MKTISAKQILIVGVLFAFMFGFNPREAQCGNGKGNGRAYGNQPNVGAWSLVSIYGESTEGDRFYPFGENASGLLIYSASGYMSVQLIGEERTDFASGDRLDYTMDEVIAAWNSYDAYCGQWEIFFTEGMKGNLYHYVKGSLLPNWMNHGRVMEIDFEFRGMHELAYIGKPFVMNGVEWTFYVIWERAE